jgi:hypothetical protein
VDVDADELSVHAVPEIYADEIFMYFLRKIYINISKILNIPSLCTIKDVNVTRRPPKSRQVKVSPLRPPKRPPKCYLGASASKIVPSQGSHINFSSGAPD